MTGSKQTLRQAQDERERGAIASGDYGDSLLVSAHRKVDPGSGQG